jgi:ferritin-like metal-binding protein YciE
MKTLHELFVDGIKDMYNAEKQLTKALPKMAKMASDQRLKEGFQNHLRQTEEHARRVEQAAATIGEKPSGMVCKAMKGLVEEASEHMKELKPSSCADAELIQLAQKVEHYEIGSYGTLCEWARLMGHEEAMNLLQQNLDEEKETDMLLTEIAESEVNRMAAEESKQMMMDGSMQKGGGSTRKRTAAKKPSGRASGGRSGGGRATGGHSKGTAAKGKTSARGKTPARKTASPRARATMR